MRKRKFSSKTGIGSVALADILANSVAVILILITLSWNAKQNQAEQQLSTTIDFNVLMARKLTSSVVMNSLPNSKPARLHNYHDCRIPHDCNLSLYPIIELQRNFVREYNSGIVFSKNDLLQQDNNPFVELISSFSKKELDNIRIDVYDISLFYLAISTLRELKAPLRHWHYLGEKTKAPVSPNLAGNNEKLAKLLEEGKAGFEDKGTSDDNQQAQSLAQQVPKNTDLLDPQLVQGLEEEQILPPTDLESPASQNSAEQEDFSNAEQSQDIGEQMYQQLVKEFSKQYSGTEMGQSKTKTFSLNLPNITINQNANQKAEIPAEIDDYEVFILTYLLKALEMGRDNQGFDLVKLQFLFKKLIDNPKLVLEYKHARWIRAMAENFGSMTVANVDDIALQINQTEQALNLVLEPNLPLKEIQLVGNIDSWQRNKATADILLRLIPFIHRGERIIMAKDYLVLLHPDEMIDDTNNRWRAVAILDPLMEHVTIGFAYSKLKANKLHFPTGVNQVRLDRQPLNSNLPTVPQRSGRQLLWLYLIGGLIIILMTIWIIHRSPIKS